LIGAELRALPSPSSGDDRRSSAPGHGDYGQYEQEFSSLIGAYGEIIADLLEFLRFDSAN